MRFMILIRNIGIKPLEGSMKRFKLNTMMEMKTMLKKLKKMTKMMKKKQLLNKLRRFLKEFRISLD